MILYKTFISIKLKNLLIKKERLNVKYWNTHKIIKPNRLYKENKNKNDASDNNKLSWLFFRNFEKTYIAKIRKQLNIK